MKAKLLFAILIFGVSMSAPSAGWTTSWDFSNPSGPLGSASHTYTSGGVSITAYGWDTGTKAAENLYGKSSGYGESGLGIAANTSDYEITSSYVIDLSLSNLVSHGINSGTITIESVQAGELGEICLSAGNPYGYTSSLIKCQSQTGGNIDTFTFNWTGISNPYLYVTGGGTGGGKDILIGTFKTVPEPSSLLLLGSGLIAFGLWGRKKFPELEK